MTSWGFKYKEDCPSTSHSDMNILADDVAQAFLLVGSIFGLDYYYVTKLSELSKEARSTQKKSPTFSR